MISQKNLAEEFFIASRNITNEKMKKKRGLISECQLLTAKYKIAIDRAIPYYLFFKR